MDFDEFAAVHKAYTEQRDADFKDEWMRMRLLATIVIQPHLGKGKKITPEKLLPLPWDKNKKVAPKTHKDKKGRELPVEQQRQRMAELVKKLGDETI